MNPSNEISIGRLVYRTAQAMTLYGEKLLNPYDLTAEQFHLLKNISSNKALSQNELCDIVQKSAANVTRILDRLERKGFVKREKNPADRRSIHLFLTVRGQELVDEVSSLFENFSRLLTKGISNQEQTKLAEILHRIQNNLSTPTETVLQ